MPLMPIRFNTAQDLNAFLGRLQDLGLITLRDGLIESVAVEFSDQFIKATDGSVHLLNDVLKYLDETSVEELNASKLSFFVQNSQNLMLSFAKDMKSVSLAEIKADRTLVEQLYRAENAASFISLLNPNIYSDKPLSVLAGEKAIEQAMTSFNNDGLSAVATIANPVVTGLAEKMRLARQLPLALPMHSSDFLLDLQRDIIKITVLQQTKLKYQVYRHLLLTRDVDERKLLQQWRRAIDGDNEKMTELLSMIANMLHSHNDRTNELQQFYTKLLAEHSDLATLEALLETKHKEYKELFDSIENTAAVLKVLKPILVYGTMIALYALLMAAIIITPAVIIALTATMPLLGLSLVMIETVSVILLSALAVDGIIELGNMIGNGLDSIVEEKCKQHGDLENEITTHALNVLLTTTISQCSPEFVQDGPKHDDVIELFEEDLAAIELLKAEVQKKMDHLDLFSRKPSASRASVAGMFQQKPGDSRADVVVEETNHGAFVIS